MPSQQVFLSYLREDEHRVEALKGELESRGFDVIDGKHTRLATDDAITRSRLFVACFSDRGYDGDALKTAIDQLQALEHDKSWLVAVRLTPCDVPAIQITPSFTLADLTVELKGFAKGGVKKPAPGQTTINSRTDIKRVQAPRAVAGGLRATGRAIRGANIKTTTTYEDVTGDESALVFGVMLTDSEDDES